MPKTPRQAVGGKRRPPFDREETRAHVRQGMAAFYALPADVGFTCAVDHIVHGYRLNKRCSCALASCASCALQDLQTAAQRFIETAAAEATREGLGADA